MKRNYISERAFKKYKRRVSAINTGWRARIVRLEKIEIENEELRKSIPELESRIERLETMVAQKS